MEEFCSMEKGKVMAAVNMLSTRGERKRETRAVDLS